MIETKTHLFNVTYLGLGIYDTVQDIVVANKKVGLLTRSQVGAIFGAFANTIAKEAKEASDLLPQMISHLGANIIPGWLSFTARNILATVSMSASPFYISGELINAISRGYIEQPQASYKNRGCVPLRNIYAQAIIDKIFKEVDEHKMAWIETLGNSIDDTSIDYLPFIAKEAPGASLKTRGTTRADYYWDKKGRLGFNDEAISMVFTKTSEQLDPDNGQRNLHSYLEVAARNEEARSKGMYEEGICLVCGENLPQTAPGTRGPKQKYCKTCKPFVKKAMDEESNKRRDKINMESSVPKDDYLFIRYFNNFYIKGKNTKKITQKDLVKTTIKKPKGKKPDNFKDDTCECGGRNFELYKPWNPDDDGRFGKIGSKVLYCKDCGLVVGYGQQSTATTGEI